MSTKETNSLKKCTGLLIPHKNTYVCFQLKPKIEGCALFPDLIFVLFRKSAHHRYEHPNTNNLFLRKNKHHLKMRGLSIPDISDLNRIDKGDLTIFNYLVTI